MHSKLPKIEHIYQHHHLDSTRWQRYIPRENDIVIATPYKSGTTWMQNIVMHLIFQDLQLRPVHDISRWLDVRTPNLDNLIRQIEAQTHRRFLKTHLPLDGLIFFPQVKYIVVGRDGRDVFMSMWNHYRLMTDDNYEAVNNTEGRKGAEFPRCPDDIHTVWQQWISRGWFDWENEGYPYWSNFRHVRTWWNFRHLSNILFVHHNDLLTNLEGELRRIADYLGISLLDDMCQQIAHAVTFSTMKKNLEDIIPEFRGTSGENPFINKGTNGRWRGVLSDEELMMYGTTVERELTSDCAQWLENGRLGS